MVSFGAARQYAIDHSYGTYLTFMDAGNIFISGSDKYILNAINKNIFFDLYHWTYQDPNKVSKQPYNLLGYVYRREFITAHNIHFCDNNDNYGFIKAHELIIDYHNSRKIIRIYNSKMKLFKLYHTFEVVTPMSRAQTAMEAIKITTIGAHITPYHILITCANIMCQLYYQFVKAYEEEPENLFDCWDAAKYFHDNCYDIYRQVGTKGAIKLYEKEYLPKIIKTIKWNIPYQPNFNRFIHELQDNEILPEKYL